MTVTAKLYRLFLTDKKIRGLRSRLTAAERFLASQQTQLQTIGTKSDAVSSQLRQLKATAANDENEAQSIEQHIEELRERMNTAQTNKEYKALLTEVNTFKEKKSEIDDRLLATMEQVESLSSQATDLAGMKGEREKVKGVAEQDREARANEIAEKLTELEAERKELAADVPVDALSTYEQLLVERGEDAMAPLEIEDAKRHEYVCGSSMMSVPVEVAISLLSGKLTLSPNDGCILYLEPEVEERLLASTGKK